MGGKKRSREAGLVNLPLFPPIRAKWLRMFLGKVYPTSLHINNRCHKESDFPVVK